MHVIGLTGSLCTGKTTAARFLAGYGAKVLDADKEAHALLAPGTSVYKKIIDQFGEEILDGKRINRRKLAQIVFTNRSSLKKLENIIHPAVYKEFEKKIKTLKRRKCKAVVLDVPLLFESRFDRLCDVTVVVSASKPVQLRRALKRGLTQIQALGRICAQMSLKNKERYADFVVRNSGTKIQLKKQVKKLWENIQ